MNPTTREWLLGLRDFAAERRDQKPARPPAVDPAASAAERSILGATLATRLAEIDTIRAARCSRQSAALPDPAADPDADPALVLTTSPVGIDAAEQLLASKGDLAAIVGDRLAAVTELEYRLWCIRHPDEGHLLHVNLWNWVKTRVPRQRWGEFAAHPLGPGESYWLHRTGLAGAGRLDRRDCHLWKWNGRHAALLQPFVAESAVSALGGDHPAD